MPQGTMTVSQAYAALGLAQGASLELVKSEYKKAALRTHPDKNQGNPNATEEFQKIGSAYDTLLRHLDGSTGGAGYHDAYHGDAYYDDAYYDDLYYEGESDEESDGGEAEYIRQWFFQKMFEEVMMGRSGRRAYFSFRSSGFRERTPPPDPEEERRQKERAEARERYERERREALERERKVRLEEERQRERREAEVRQKAKANNKKAKAAASKKAAEKTAKQLQERTQKRRSEVFASARRGDAKAVKAGVWENNVDAAGGEIKTGHEAFVDVMPADRSETLLHIAAGRGDTELVKWLNDHNADPEERNGQDYTAFHVALNHGHSLIVKYFFGALPPKESEYAEVYRAPDETSLLRLAVASGDPEVVYFVLKEKLATTDEARAVWNTLPIPPPRARGKKPSPLSTREEDLRELLMEFAGVGPEEVPECTPARSSSPSSSESEVAPKTPVVEAALPPQVGKMPPSQAAGGDGNHQYHHARGRGRGRWRGRGRGNNRGRGRGQ